ncbi:MAG: DUF368 domain-containing protein [Peptoniphilaceae bacterium]|nr:DUF368 domain-containing protein [Peptoniphilaceae bacterium]
MTTWNERPDSRPGVGPWLIRLVKGTLVGIGAILPGLSGGVLSVIFGLYRPLIDFLSNITQDVGKNVRYFLPVGIGGLLGVFLFSLFVEKAFGQYAAQFVCLFLGFVIGTLPALYREAGLRGRTARDRVIMVAAAAFIFFLMLMGANLPQVTPSVAVWFFSGALVALGFIVPGMSPSNFLIYFGLYDKMAAGISGLDLGMLIPFALGMVACIVLLSKLVAHLFEVHYSKMYHAILGMVIGSTLGIVPSIILPAYTPEGLAAAGLSLPLAIGFGGIMLIVGIVISYQFSRLEAKVNHE